MNCYQFRKFFSYSCRACESCTETTLITSFRFNEIFLYFGLGFICIVFTVSALLGFYFLGIILKLIIRAHFRPETPFGGVRILPQGLHLFNDPHCLFSRIPQVNRNQSAASVQSLFRLVGTPTCFRKEVGIKSIIRVGYFWDLYGNSKKKGKSLYGMRGDHARKIIIIIRLPSCLDLTVDEQLHS
jgi:hypothetical protein